MREIRFTFLLDSGERRMLKELAEYLQRSQSDTLRLLIKEVVRTLKEQDADRQSIEAENVAVEKILSLSNSSP